MKWSATPAPVMNHLWPWITQPPDFFSARVRIMPGSEPPPGAGSVIANDERTSPATIGASHLSFCALVPVSASKFILPSSGAWQLNASGPKIERLASSYITAQPTIGSASPPYSFGACGAHRPCARAFACRPRSTSSRRFSWSSKLARSASSGSTCSSTKRRVRTRMSSSSGVRLKSMAGLSALRRRVPASILSSLPARREG